MIRCLSILSDYSSFANLFSSKILFETQKFGKYAKNHRGSSSSHRGRGMRDD